MLMTLVYVAIIYIYIYISVCVCVCVRPIKILILKIKKKKKTYGPSSCTFSKGKFGTCGLESKREFFSSILGLMEKL